MDLIYWRTKVKFRLGSFMTQLQALLATFLAYNVATIASCLVAIRAVGYALPLPDRDIDFALTVGTIFGTAGSLLIGVPVQTLWPESRLKSILVGSSLFAIIVGLGFYHFCASAASC